MLSRLCRSPAYVSLSRFRIDTDSSCICCRMKLEPMKPAPPVTRMRFCMRNVARSGPLHANVPAAGQAVDCNKKGRRSPSSVQILRAIVTWIKYSPRREGRLAGLPFPSCTLASDDPGIAFLWRFHTIQKVPSHQPEVCFFNVPGNLLPLILFLDPPPCRPACRLPDRRIRK